MNDDRQTEADCGHVIDENFAWPGEGGTTICHACWEAECDASWWEAAGRVIA